MSTTTVPMRAFQSWNMSLHPQGPMTSFLCGDCDALNKARVARYRHTRSSMSIHCTSCGALNRAPYVYG